MNLFSIFHNSAVLSILSVIVMSDVAILVTLTVFQAIIDMVAPK
jgi:hypothetical protein